MWPKGYGWSLSKAVGSSGCTGWTLLDQNRCLLWFLRHDFCDGSWSLEYWRHLSLFTNFHSVHSYISKYYSSNSFSYRCSPQLGYPETLSTWVYFFLKFKCPYKESFLKFSIVCIADTKTSDCVFTWRSLWLTGHILSKFSGFVPSIHSSVNFGSKLLWVE